MLEVRSPVAGRTLAVGDLPDRVFAEGMVGPGVAIRPRPGDQRALAPVTGRLVKLHPHAYVVLTESGHGVLVHLGIDTVHLRGEGFRLHAVENQTVRAGDQIVSWDPAHVEGTGRSSTCAVVVLDSDPATVRAPRADTEVEANDVLFEVAG